VLRIADRGPVRDGHLRELVLYVAQVRHDLIVSTLLLNFLGIRLSRSGSLGLALLDFDRQVCHLLVRDHTLLIRLSLNADNTTPLQVVLQPVCDVKLIDQVTVEVLLADLSLILRLLRVL